MDTASLDRLAPAEGRFRLGLMGAGRMGRTHLEVIHESADVAVTGVVEPLAEARARIRNSAVPAYASMEEMLAAGDIDGVLIAAPTDQHVKLVRQVMAMGIPVLCEKPCGLSVAEAAECAAVATDAGLLLQVAYWRRFVPQLVALRQRILAGELGDILAVNCYQWDQAPPPAEFRASSGGMFVDMGVHEFDQIRWLTGQEFATVQVAASELGTSPTDPDCAQLVARLDGGSTAVVSLGRWHPGGDSCKVEVFGTRGTASSWFLSPADGDAVFRTALRIQAEDFARAARAGTGSGASVADAVVALTVAALAADPLAADPLAAPAPA